MLLKLKLPAQVAVESLRLPPRSHVREEGVLEKVLESPWQLVTPDPQLRPPAQLFRLLEVVRPLEQVQMEQQLAPLAQLPAARPLQHPEKDAVEPWVERTEKVERKVFAVDRPPHVYHRALMSAPHPPLPETVESFAL